MTQLQYLFDLERFGIKLGLENIRRLLAEGDRPQDRLLSVHVGGTNGKGSTAALLEAMLRAGGLRVGKFTSPHLIDISERFIVDGRPISPDELDRQIAFFRAIAERMDPPPTFFEMNTAIAFRWFATEHVDIALIEVGMGGRFDSTNVIEPLVSVVTNIGLEHTEHLGDTLEKIAFEKAGIIKSGTPVILGEREPGPRDVLLSRASELGSPALLCGRDFDGSVSGPAFEQMFSYTSPALRLGPVPLALAGAFQAANAALAVAAAERLMPRFPGVTVDSIIAGLASASWPCRMEKVLNTPPVIIDVAHNPHGAAVLAEQLPPCVVVMAVSSDKAATAIIEALGPVTATLVLTEFSGRRAMPLDVLRAAAGARAHESAPTLREAIQRAMPLASSHRPLLITGSVFTAGEARRILTEDYGAPAPAFGMQ